MTAARQKALLDAFFLEALPFPVEGAYASNCSLQQQNLRVQVTHRALHGYALHCCRSVGLHVCTSACFSSSCHNLGKLHTHALRM